MSEHLVRESLSPDMEVLGKDEISAKYRSSSLGIDRATAGVIFPENAEHIQKILKLAHAHKLLLYPVSVGNNWGYGGSLPIKDGSWVVNLKKMKGISEFNEELGTITLEPGVTQQDLYEFLFANGNSWLVPTTGAGPRASIMGNALERGYGLTPHFDHFRAVHDLEVILADGSLWQSNFRARGALDINAAYPWDIGPSLTGIFSQSNFGIVVKATISLHRRAEEIGMFVKKLKAENLKDAVVEIRQIKRDLGSLCGGINLMNESRMKAMLKSDQPETNTTWTIAGNYYGPTGVNKLVRRVLSRVGTGYKIYRPYHFNLLDLLYNKFPSFRETKLGKEYKVVRPGYDIFCGKPQLVAFPLAYLKHDNPPTSFETADPDADGCGLIWFTPLIPMDPSKVELVTDTIHRICKAHGMPPMITLTTLSEKCFDASVPIVFNRRDPSAVKSAQDCLQVLHTELSKLGSEPYRLSIGTMNKIFKENQISPSQILVKKIKNVLDPQNILAAGRYE
ncbi:MAG: FAD-binding oxidoreductase [Proteobacteria bacterium]|nr:MAG: FAD-binding oxidoreductase [Pseudomonadota bacterium]